MTATAPPTSPAEYGNLPTGAAHDVTVDLDPVRIRVLDRFGAPCANASCDVDTPLLGTRTVTTDGQGWLEIQCPKGTDHVDLKLSDATEDAARSVLLLPAADDDDKQTKRRLLNLGFDGTLDGPANGDSASDGSAGDSGGSGDSGGGDSGGASSGDSGAGGASDGDAGGASAGDDSGGDSDDGGGDSGSGGTDAASCEVCAKNGYVGLDDNDSGGTDAGDATDNDSGGTDAGDATGSDSGGSAADTGNGGESSGGTADAGDASGGDSSGGTADAGGASGGGSGGPSDPAQFAFLREHGVDPAGDDFDSQLDRVENDYQTLDDPSERDLTTMLDDQVPAGDPGERT